jgi:hypothetical protein
VNRSIVQLGSRGLDRGRALEQARRYSFVDLGLAGASFYTGATTSGVGVAVDIDGTVYVTGTTDGTLSGARQGNAGSTT